MDVNVVNDTYMNLYLFNEVYFTKLIQNLNFLYSSGQTTTFSFFLGFLGGLPMQISHMIWNHTCCMQVSSINLQGLLSACFDNSCLFKFEEPEKLSSQYLHLYGFSPRCIIWWCRVTAKVSGNRFPQSSQVFASLVECLR